jgi:rod shape-determining protein MreD
VREVWWKVVLGMLVALVLHEKLPDHLALGRVRPDLALLGLFVVTLRYGPNVGVWTGFVAGLFLDVSTPEHLGARALSFSVASYVMGRVAEQVDSRSLPVQVVLLGILGIVDAVLLSGARHLVRPGLAFREIFTIHVPDLGYTLLLAAVLLLLLGTRLLPRRMSWRGAR